MEVHITMQQHIEKIIIIKVPPHIRAAKRESREIRELSRNCNHHKIGRQNAIGHKRSEKVPADRGKPGDLPRLIGNAFASKVVVYGFLIWIPFHYVFSFAAVGIAFFKRLMSLKYTNCYELERRI